MILPHSFEEFFPFSSSFWEGSCWRFFNVVEICWFLLGGWEPFQSVLQFLMSTCTFDARFGHVLWSLFLWTLQVLCGLVTGSSPWFHCILCCHVAACGFGLSPVPTMSSLQYFWRTILIHCFLNLKFDVKPLVTRALQTCWSRLHFVGFQSVPNSSALTRLRKVCPPNLLKKNISEDLHPDPEALVLGWRSIPPSNHFSRGRLGTLAAERNDKMRLERFRKVVLSFRSLPSNLLRLWLHLAQLSPYIHHPSLTKHPFAMALRYRLTFIDVDDLEICVSPRSSSCPPACGHGVGVRLVSDMQCQKQAGSRRLSSLEDLSSKLHLAFTRFKTCGVRTCRLVASHFAFPVTCTKPIDRLAWKYFHQYCSI